MRDSTKKRRSLSKKKTVSNAIQLNNKQKKEAERFLEAVKKDTKNNNALHNYFATYTDKQIISVCKIVKIKDAAKKSRSVNTHSLISKIRDNRSTYLEIAIMGISGFLTLMASCVTALAGLGFVGAYNRVLTNTVPEDQRTAVDCIILFATIFSIGSIGSYFQEKHFKRTLFKGRKRQKSTIRKIHDALQLKS